MSNLIDKLCWAGMTLVIVFMTISWFDSMIILNNTDLTKIFGLQTDPKRY